MTLWCRTFRRSKRRIRTWRCLVLITVVLLPPTLLTWYARHRISTWSGIANFDICKQAAPMQHRTKESQSWQSVSGRNVSVFSAYVDGRVAVGGPLVRVIASGFQTAFNKVGDLHCQLWYDNLQQPLAATVPAQYEVIYPSIMHEQMWVAHFVLCSMPPANFSSGRLVGVSIVGDDHCATNAGNYLVVMETSRKEQNKAANSKPPTFALCLPVLYARSDSWLQLVEWIELHKLLGISEIIVYNMSTSSNIATVLKSYRQVSETDNQRKDVLNVQPGPPDIELNVVQWQYPSDRLTSYFSHHEAINDCIYRAASRGHRYVSVNDLDEVLVPRGTSHVTMADFVREQTPEGGAYLFQHAYFRRNKTRNTKPYLVSMQSLWRTEKVVPAGNIMSKALYDVGKVIKANIHSPYKLVEGATIQVVDPAHGMLHHYRNSPMQTFVKQPNLFRFIEDKFLLKYQEKLELAVTWRLQLSQMKLNT